MLTKETKTNNLPELIPARFVLLGFIVSSFNLRFFLQVCSLPAQKIKSDNVSNQNPNKTLKSYIPDCIIFMNALFGSICSIGIN